jgi:hypothetical protein
VPTDAIVITIALALAFERSILVKDASRHAFNPQRVADAAVMWPNGHASTAGDIEVLVFGVVAESSPFAHWPISIAVYRHRHHPPLARGTESLERVAVTAATCSSVV